MLTIKDDRLNLGDGNRILDLGCGQGRHSFYLSKLGYLLVPVDIFFDDLLYTSTIYKTMLEYGEIKKKSLAMSIEADALRLPFANNSFDCVIASEILEHIDEDYLVISEIARVIKPGAVLAVSVPRYYPEVINWLLSKKYHSVKGGHVRIYRKSQLLCRLRKENFYLTGIDYAHGLHSPYWWLKCLVGVDNERNLFVRLYKKLLEYEIIKQPLLLKWVAKILDPLLGKSIVIYTRYLPDAN